MEQYTSRSIISGTALVIGAIFFAVGFIGPLIVFPESNLGPLFGIFLTGPVGFILGILVGIVRSLRQPAEGSLRRELYWLGLAWVLSLLFMLIFAFTGLGWVALAVQIAVLGTGIFVLEKKAATLPGWAHQGGLILVLAGALTIVASVFPPVVSKAGDARFAFFLDRRFDASRHVPEYSIDESLLLQEWLFIAAIAGALVLTLRAFANPRRQ